MQAAGLQHPNDIGALHIVRRGADHEVRLLANVLPFVPPGALLAAARGEADWPHNVYRHYWPLASAHSFAPRRSVSLPAQPLADSAWALLG